MSDDYVPTQHQGLDKSEVSEPAQYVGGIPQLGQKFLDRYEVFGINTKGGFGLVFFVTDTKSGKEYAVKTYKPEFKTSSQDMERFNAEVDSWISLDPHPNIVKACFVEVVQRQIYLFVEYVSGNVLRNLIGRLTSSEAINFAYQICLAMECVNRRPQKVVHADLKPENILITQEGIAKVTDFGLAKPFNFYGGNFPYELAGTTQYMPPEQLHGEVFVVNP